MTPNETPIIQPAAIVIAAVLATYGVTRTLKSARAERKAADERARKDRETQAETAYKNRQADRDLRILERRSDAYVEVADWAIRLREAVRGFYVDIMFVGTRASATRQLPIASLDEIDKMRALIATFGSEAMRSLIDRASDLVGAFMDAAAALDAVRAERATNAMPTESTSEPRFSTAHQTLDEHLALILRTIPAELVEPLNADR
ncbi:MAG: hypothetical protein ACQSGP_28695 [Frankia sp.]